RISGYKLKTFTIHKVSELRGPKSGGPAKSAPMDIRAPGEKPAVKMVRLANVLAMQNKIKDLADLVGNFSGSGVNELVSSNFGKYYNLENSMKSLDSSSKFSVDGIWGKNTRAALVMALNLAGALLNTNNSLRLGANWYSLKDYEALNTVLKSHTFDKNNRIELNKNDQEKHANFITEHLNGIIRFYSDLVNKAQSNPKLNLDKDRSLIKNEISNVTPVSLNENDLREFNRLKDLSFKITRDNGVSYNLPVNALKDKNTLFSWLGSNNIVQNDAEAQQEFLKF